MKRIGWPWGLLWKDHTSSGKVSAIRLNAHKLFKVWMEKWIHGSTHFRVLTHCHDFSQNIVVWNRISDNIAICRFCLLVFLT